jgi:hypothetical protein
VSAWVVALAALALVQTGCQWQARPRFPSALTDQQFRTLIIDVSESPGAFEHSTNLVSNEIRYVHTVGRLRPVRGAYIGVGPEQNYSFIAALRPAIAFIVDIRQENQYLHLLYKTLFELSADRGEFVSRLFSRELQPGIGPGTSVDELFRRYTGAPGSRELYQATAGQVRERLRAHGWRLTEQDMTVIDGILHAFYAKGPEIHYERPYPGEAPDPSYSLLMTARDIHNQSGSYLATTDRFAFVKGLHDRNMIVPVVGDFAGPHAIRRVGDYIRRHRGMVSAFYASNVEVYLNRRQSHAFCRSLATLPFTSRTSLIDSKGWQPLPGRLAGCPPRKGGE